MWRRAKRGQEKWGMRWEGGKEAEGDGDEAEKTDQTEDC
jgi:hypothetical protein